MENLPWERQPEETESAWAAFQIYRDMPSKRTMLGAYKIYVEQKKQKKAEKSRVEPPSPDSAFSDSELSSVELKTPSSWNGAYGYANRFKWEERVRAYDREQERRRRQERDRIHQEEMETFQAELREDCKQFRAGARMTFTKALEALKVVNMSSENARTLAYLLVASGSLIKLTHDTNFVALGIGDLVEVLDEVTMSDPAEPDGQPS